MTFRESSHNPWLILTTFIIGTAKAGLDMLTKMMGLELGPHKVSHTVLLLLSPDTTLPDSSEHREPDCCHDRHGETGLVGPK